MKIFATLLLLAGATTFSLSAQAQAVPQPIWKPKQKAPIRVVDPAKYSSTGYDLTPPKNPTNDPTLTKREQREAEKKLTPYAQAVLNNELLREEPAKANENGVF